jgi:outer membrane immunogenic protein
LLARYSFGRPLRLSLILSAALLRLGCIDGWKHWPVDGDDRKEVQMKTRILALGSAACIALLANGAIAADLPARAPAPVFVAAPFNWSGFYVGAVGTLGMMSSEMSDHWCDTSCQAPSLREFGGGIGGTIGYNMQYGSMVFGVEGDLSWVSFDNSYNHVDFNNDGSISYQSIHSTQWNWYGTIRARMGLAFDRTLAYVTAGVAFVGVENRANYLNNDGTFDGGFVPKDSTQTGFAVGVGVEHAFTNNWTLKAEYMYIGLPSKDGGRYCDEDNFDQGKCGADLDDSRIHYRSDAHVARIGLNYKF